MSAAYILACVLLLIGTGIALYVPHHFGRH